MQKWFWRTEWDLREIYIGHNGFKYFIKFYFSGTLSLGFSNLKMIKVQIFWNLPIWGRSQTTLTRFWLFLTTYPPVLTFQMGWTKNAHFWTTYLPHLVNVVCERPLFWDVSKQFQKKVGDLFLIFCPSHDIWTLLRVCYTYYLILLVDI